MSFRPNPPLSFVTVLLHAIGMLGKPAAGLTMSQGPQSMGPYARKAAAKKRNKFWAKNR